WAAFAYCHLCYGRSDPRAILKAFLLRHALEPELLLCQERVWVSPPRQALAASQPVEQLSSILHPLVSGCLNLKAPKIKAASISLICSPPAFSLFPAHPRPSHSHPA